MKAIDFFCGTGGLTRGLLDAGIQVVAGLDIDATCQKTYEHNNSSSRFIEADITKIDLTEVSRHTRLREFDDVLFAGCAPCQPFSTQSRRKSSNGTETILSRFGCLVEMARPGFVLVENVPGMARVQGYSTFQRFCKMLERNGYSYASDVLDAKDFGVPQNRRRLVLIATRNKVTNLPRPSYGTIYRAHRTVREAIGHFPAIAAGECDPNIPNHEASIVSDLNLDRLRHTPHDGGDRRSWPERLRLNCHKGDYEGHTDVYGRMAWDRPSPTLTGKCNSISNGRYGHPVQDRAISLREAAALQSFPDGYVFFGYNFHIAQHIGNAVPVRFAERLGRHILRLRDGKM